jgi:hypothetical protein
MVEKSLVCVIYLIRISFGILLVASILLITVTIIIIMTASSNRDDDDLSSSRGNNFFFFTRWGRVGVQGQQAEAGPMTRDNAIRQYNSKLNDKTRSGNYRIV